jgi:hypothetical protein
MACAPKWYRSAPTSWGCPAARKSGSPYYLPRDGEQGSTRSDWLQACQRRGRNCVGRSPTFLLARPRRQDSRASSPSTSGFSSTCDASTPHRRIAGHVRTELPGPAGRFPRPSSGHCRGHDRRRATRYAGCPRVDAMGRRNGAEQRTQPARVGGQGRRDNILVRAFPTPIAVVSQTSRAPAATQPAMLLPPRRPSSSQCKPAVANESGPIRSDTPGGGIPP